MTALQKCIGNTFDTGERISDFVSQSGSPFVKLRGIRPWCKVISIFHSLARHNGMADGNVEIERHSRGGTALSLLKIATFWESVIAWEV